jgi:hypothetical protein
VAFEYPINAQRTVDPFVIRAARAVDHSHNDSCEATISASQGSQDAQAGAIAARP